MNFNHFATNIAFNLGTYSTPLVASIQFFSSSTGASDNNNNTIIPVKIYSNAETPNGGYHFMGVIRNLEFIDGFTMRAKNLI